MVSEDETIMSYGPRNQSPFVGIEPIYKSSATDTSGDGIALGPNWLDNFRIADRIQEFNAGQVKEIRTHARIMMCMFTIQVFMGILILILKSVEPYENHRLYPKAICDKFR